MINFLNTNNKSLDKTISQILEEVIRGYFLKVFRKQEIISQLISPNKNFSINQIITKKNKQICIFYFTFELKTY